MTSIRPIGPDNDFDRAMREWRTRRSWERHEWLRTFAMLATAALTAALVVLALLTYVSP